MPSQLTALLLLADVVLPVHRERQLPRLQGHRSAQRQLQHHHRLHQEHRRLQAQLQLQARQLPLQCARPRTRACCRLLRLHQLPPPALLGVLQAAPSSALPLQLCPKTRSLRSCTCSLSRQSQCRRPQALDQLALVLAQA